MSPPTSILAGMSSIRIPNPSTRRQKFSFTKVFSPETSQSDIFTTTTLPLVKDVLRGENGLLFAYGVTNSGKTYTIQGKSGDEQSGILPRALDVIFNSVEGYQDAPSVSLPLSFIYVLELISSFCFRSQRRLTHLRLLAQTISS